MFAVLGGKSAIQRGVEMSRPHSLIAKHRHEWRDHENDEADCHRQAGVCEKNCESEYCCRTGKKCDVEWIVGVNEIGVQREECECVDRNWLTVHLVVEAQLDPHVAQPRAPLLAGQAPLERRAAVVWCGNT